MATDLIHFIFVGDIHEKELWTIIGKYVSVE